MFSNKYNIESRNESILEKSVVVPGIPYPIYDGGLRFFEQTRRIGTWPIDNNYKTIIDIGCGHTPFPYANILVDKNIHDSKDRFGFSIPNDGRSIIEADIEAGLPFNDKEIDFLYCSHTLEHCSDPEQAVHEIIRVAKEGFIETPNIIYELLFGGNESLHKWITEYDESKNILAFRKITISERKAIDRRRQLGEYPKQLFLDPFCKNRLHKIAYWKNQELFTNCFLWKNDFKIKVNGRLVFLSNDKVI